MTKSLINLRDAEDNGSVIKSLEDLRRKSEEVFHKPNGRLENSTVASIKK